MLQNSQFFKGQSSVLMELSADKLNLSRNIQLILRNQIQIRKYLQESQGRDSFAKVFMALKDFCLNSKEFKHTSEKGQNLLAEYFSAIFQFLKFTSLYSVAEKSLNSEGIDAGEFFRAIFLEFLAYFSNCEGHYSH